MGSEFIAYCRWFGDQIFEQFVNYDCRRAAASLTYTTLFSIVPIMAVGFWILTLMTGHIWKSGLIAALFAIHPQHIQSVAWVAERKDLLSTFFGLLTVRSYLGYVRRPEIGRYMPVLFFFVLSLMSKPMLVTLPLVLLLLDYWPLNRLHLPAKSDGTGSKMPAIVSQIVEKGPLLLVSAASCLVTLHAQQAGGAVSSLDLYPLHIRIINALVSYASYIGKMIWPAKLAAIYPYPG